MKDTKKEKEVEGLQSDLSAIYYWKYLRRTAERSVRDILLEVLE
jgi:hypothetical protein